MIININGKNCEANEGDYLLEVARANDIFIPAICYLHDCTPTLACRMCMVEIDGKRSYACNTKVKDGMVVLSDTKELWDERNAIMQTYCINHPLQCGVCDKSGECELQNFTLRAKVDTQNHYIKDFNKTPKNWGLLQYDPSLCIVCERCITVCKDKIGENELKTTPRGGDAIDKSFKDTMSKDAFAVWSKFQKSLITTANDKSLECSECGECTSVCPTGALINKHFQYTSNVWELLRVPASNPHSSDCELMYYDVKQKSIKDSSRMIYRVSNDFHFTTLNKAARFAYDTQSECKYKDEAAFNELVNLFKNKKIKNVKFNSFITNEEAYILELLRAKYDFNLVNLEALAFQEFLNSFCISANEFYNASSEDVKNADFIITLGSFLRHDNPTLSYKVNNALVVNKASGIYFHPILDEKVSKYSKNFISVNYDFGDELSVLEFIIKHFVKELPKELEYILTKEFSFLDEAKLKDLLLKKSKYCLIVGSDFIYHENALYFAKLLGFIQKSSEFKVMLIPTCTNTLGVSLICKLTNPSDGFTLGYNERGDFSFSNDLENNLISSSLIQQEGTFVNYDKRLVPTNAALPFDGYFLNDLANALDLYSDLTTDYTAKLPLNKGFRGTAFDDLENHYDNAGINHRGYLINTFEYVKGLEFKSVENKEPISTLNQEKVIILANPVGNLSKYSNKSSFFNECACLYASNKYLTQHNLKENEMIKLSDGENELIIKVVLDKDIQNYAYLPTFDDKINPFKFFKTKRFCELNVEVLS